MKYLIATLLLGIFLAITEVNAQDAKVIERSAKNAPEWLYRQPADYIVVDVEAPSLSDAKDKAVEEIATRIVMSVAENVLHDSSFSATEENIDGKWLKNESYSIDTKIASVRIPFIKGISLTEAKDSYWTKCREKKTNRIFYRYAVLYPLPNTTLETLRRDFEALDTEKSRSLKVLKEDLATVNSSSQIERAVTELSGLTEYFFDGVRKKEAEGLLVNYKQLYKGLTLKATRPDNGSFRVTLLLQGRPFEVTGVPSLKSNCASRLEAQPLADGTGYEVTYNDIDCLPEEDNWIEVSLRMRDTRICQKVHIGPYKQH